MKQFSEHADGVQISDWTPVLRQVSAVLEREMVDARRVFHGRGGCFPGFEALGIDHYPPFFVVTLYASFSADCLVELARCLQRLAPVSGVLLQHREQFKSPWEVLAGTAPVGEVVCREAGLSYEVSFMQKQNFGFFPDMRLGRELVRNRAAGKRVLNLFSYTCAFSVAACAGGAASVVNLDMSSAALSVGRRNHRLNRQPLENIRFFAHDIFKSFGKLRRLGPFDLVIIDPPTDQGRSFRVQSDYARLLRRLPDFCAPDAELLACLNAPKMPASFLEELVAEEVPEFRCIEKLSSPPEFAEKDADAGLKLRLYRRGNRRRRGYGGQEGEA